jgi:hypothetical protein
MGLLERIRGEVRPTEQRFSLDTWISDYLIPNTFQFGNTTYPFGLPNTTMAQSRLKSIANSLPGYLGALRSCPPAFAARDGPGAGAVPGAVHLPQPAVGPGQPAEDLRHRRALAARAAVATARPATWSG